MRVLVAYGTKRGSTAGIADIIGETLREDGIEADVLPAGRAGEVATYDAVVLGGALYAMRWHRDARRFARHHAKEIGQHPVWLFSSGPIDHSAEERDIPPVKSTAAAMKQLHARGHVTFGGRLDAGARGFIASRMAKNTNGDFRNPERIKAWAHGIATELKSGAAAA